MSLLHYPKTIGEKYRKSPSGRTLWCGPFALAILAGIQYDEAYSKTLSVEKRRLNKQAKAKGLKPGYWNPRSIQGVDDTLLQEVARLIKIKVNWIKGSKNTILDFSENHTVKGRTYLIVGGNHYMIIKDGILYHSHHDPMPVVDAPKYRMARVTLWSEVKPRLNN